MARGLPVSPDSDSLLPFRKEWEGGAGNSSADREAFPNCEASYPTPELRIQREVDTLGLHSLFRGVGPPPGRLPLFRFP